MFELQGKFATAKVFADMADEKAIAQVISLLNQSYAEGSRIRMMPDIHAGAGCTIGTTMTITDKVCPNLVGVDIGCGMETTRLCETHVDFEALDRLIRQSIPSGFAIRKDPHRYAARVNLNDLYCADHVDIDRAYRSIGTLGGGNHFIEVDRDQEGDLYLVIHSGSRHLGVEIATYYQKAAFKALTRRPGEIQDVIEQLKKEGRQREIQTVLQAMKAEKPWIPEQLAYAEGELMEQYLHDMQIAQTFAALNRQAMTDVILDGMGLHEDDQFTTVHNYIDLDHMILRKGSVSAQDGETLLIPINMRDGSLLCVGKGNGDWNCSAPHGAGRLMSRSAAKEAFTVAEFRQSMDGIYTTSVSASTLDECPMAYKSMESILQNIGPTVDVVSVLKPVYNFKAGEEAPNGKAKSPSVFRNDL